MDARHDASRLAGGEGHRHGSAARALGDNVSHQQGVFPQVEVSALDGFWPTPENRETGLEPERASPPTNGWDARHAQKADACATRRLVRASGPPFISLRHCGNSSPNFCFSLPADSYTR